MVRQIVGILVEAGRGRLTPEEVGAFFTDFSAVPARFTAPPSGLFLERIFYGNERQTYPLLPAVVLFGAKRKKS